VSGQPNIQNMKRLAWSSLLLFMVATWPAAAQSWDASGNGLLNGTYYFRQVMWLGGYNSANDLQEAIAVYGSIVFGGNGTYTLTAKAADAAKNTLTPITGSGTYTIAASDIELSHQMEIRPGACSGRSRAGDWRKCLASEDGVLLAKPHIRRAISDGHGLRWIGAGRCGVTRRPFRSVSV